MMPYKIMRLKKITKYCYFFYQKSGRLFFRDIGGPSGCWRNAASPLRPCKWLSNYSLVTLYYGKT